MQPTSTNATSTMTRVCESVVMQVPTAYPRMSDAM